MIERIAGCILVTVLGVTPAGAWARLPETATQVVAAAQIASLATRVARSLVNDADRALAPAFAISDQSVPAGTLALVTGTPQRNATYVSVPIVIDVNGKPARTIFAGFRITTYVQMPVAAHDLAPGLVVCADDLTYTRSAYTGRAPLTIDTFIGRKIRSVVARGELMYPELTVVNEIVRAGMPALLIVHDGPVRLAADVVARSSGGLGDYVTVFNPLTQKALSGIVTGSNTVELTLPGANE